MQYSQPNPCKKEGHIWSVINSCWYLFVPKWNACDQPNCARRLDQKQLELYYINHMHHVNGCGKKISDARISAVSLHEAMLTRAARSVICGFASLCCNLSYERCCTKVVQRKSSHCSSPQLNFHA